MRKQPARRAMVTGGAGFLGVHVVERLLNRGWSVLVIDNFVNGRREHVQRFAANSQFKFAEGDITNRNFMRQIVAGFQPDVVFHLAAIHFIPYCSTHPADTLNINVVGTQVLLDALKDTQVCSVVLASTADVYVVSEAPHSEQDPIEATNIYGLSKIIDEQLFQLAQACNPTMRFFAARLSNLFGPGETNPHVLPDIINYMRRGSVVRIGNVEPRRDYIYVGDAAEALLNIATYKGSHRIFNVSTGIGSSVAELVHVLKLVTGIDLRIDIDPAKVRRVDRRHLVLENSLVRRELGWSALVSLQEGLKLTLAESGLMTRAAGVAAS